MSTLLDKPADLTPAEAARARLSTRPMLPELLSPAGDWDAMRAAVANGADAVYFGLDQFNARYRATNFKREELPEIMKFLHDRNVKGFITLNTLLFSDELGQVQEYIRDIALAGVDAVIVQDFGLCRLIRAITPTLEIHGSTQMTLTEHRGVEYVKRLGVTRAVLGRELSIDEIRKLALSLIEREAETHEKLPELEVFIHGALCVSYSGQCLTSEALGGRSANRGQCAQACRLPYDLIVDGQKRDLGDKAYLLSPQDLAGYDVVSELAEIGVSCLKIEGRLKSAHYVAATTQTYRSAIDAVAAQRPFQISQEQKTSLEQTFSRGLTPGFLAGINHQTLVHARFPKSRGRRLGTVQSITNRGVEVLLAAGVYPDQVRPGDGIVFDEGHPEQQEQGGRIFAVRMREDASPPRNAPLQRGRQQGGNHRAPVKGPQAIEIELGRGDVNLGKIVLGAVVWKTDDPAMKRRLENTFSRDITPRRIPVDASVTAHVGGHLSLALSDGTHSVESRWVDKPLEASIKFPASEATLREQLSRLGDTPFELRGLTTDLRGGPMIPKSVLNDIRRDAAEALLEKRQAARLVSNPDALTDLRADAIRWKAPTALPSATTGILPMPDIQTSAVQELPMQDPAVQEPPVLGLDARASDKHNAALHVLVRDLPQLHAALVWGSANRGALSSLIADFEDVRHYKDAVFACRGAGVPITLATVRIIKPREEGFLRFILDCKPDALLIRNLAGLAVAKHFAPSLPLVGDYALNISNELTAALFAEEGLTRFVPSYDLSFTQLGAMMNRFDARYFEAVVHQHMPMFHTEHCTFSHVLSDGTDYRTCGRPCETHRVELKDREGQPHPLLVDVGCRNTVFNAAAQSALEYIPQMLKMGIQHFRVELLRETGESVGPLLSKYKAVLHGQADAVATVRSLRVLNQLGVTRGTLDRE